MIYAIFGLVLLGFGLLAFWLQDPLLVAVQVLPALVLLAVAGFGHRAEIRERLSGQLAQRNAWFGSNVALQIAAVIGLLTFAGYLAQRYPVHWDWTEAGAHTLAEGSRQVLERIPEDGSVEIYAFYSNPAAARELLDLYTYASDRVSYRLVDANKDPLLASRFEILSDGVLVICGGPCEGARATVRTTERSEQKVTEAIRSVISQRKRVYFVIGHDESEPSRGDAEGMSQIASALGAENIEHDTLLLAQADRVPEDAAALIVAAPSFSFFARELEMLDAYLRTGGRALILADALQKAKLGEMLERYAIVLGDDIIVEQQLQLLGQAQMSAQPVVSDYADHPVTAKMRGRFTLFPLARSVEPAEGSGGDVKVLLRTGPQSFAVPDTDVDLSTGIPLDPATAREGPVSLAVARTFPVDAEEIDEGRLVVVGDSDFAKNRYFAEAGNADLFLNMINWLVGEEGFIAIDRKLPRASRVDLTAAQFRTFSYLGVLFVPEAIFLLGIWNWWRRRHA